jgi:hypothetical protein
VKAESIRVLGENVIAAGRIEGGLEVLREVEAAGVRRMPVGRVGGLPSGREDGLGVRIEPRGLIIDAELTAEIGIRAGRLEHQTNCRQIDGLRLGRVEVHRHGVPGLLEKVHESEGILVPAARAAGGRNDPGGLHVLGHRRRRIGLEQSRHGPIHGHSVVRVHERLTGLIGVEVDRESIEDPRCRLAWAFRLQRRDCAREQTHRGSLQQCSRVRPRSAAAEQLVA